MELDIIPGTKTKLNILKSIYETPGINLNGIIRQTHASPNKVLSYANILLDFKVIKEDKIQGDKKVHIRRLYPNLNSELSYIIFSHVEFYNTSLFFQKYEGIKPFLKQLQEVEGIMFLIVYGSYARLESNDESDLDVLLVGKISKKNINLIREMAVTLKPELSLKIEDYEGYLSNQSKPLYQNIIKNHIIVKGVINFLKSVNEI